MPEDWNAERGRIENMTNLQHILADKELAKTLILKAIENGYGLTTDGRLMPCNEVKCDKCRFKCIASLGEVIEEEWLDKEYQEPLPFPIGTPIEVEEHMNNVVICYYNGVKDGIHVGVCNKKNIGTDKGFTISIDTARKVGE